MPNENIDRAIKKGTGEDSTTRLEKAIYEGYGPFQVPVVILTITDNKNRTVNEIRSVFTKAGGELGSIGAVMWQFTESGRIIVRSVKIRKGEKFGEQESEVKIDREEAMLELMEVPDVEDIAVNEDEIEQILIQAPTNRLAQVGQAIKEKGYVIVSSGQHFEAKNKMELSEENQNAFANFIDAIEDQQDVQRVWFAIE
jgi:transcriptional/translational regulatory protein YebC/TACO1